MEIKELEINLNVEGWEVSGGKSQNVWGQVPVENLPFDEFNKAVVEGRKSCIWTCYDEDIYKKDKNGTLLPPQIENLPKTISATFKPTFTKYSAVAENMATRIAIALGLPTSYNYLVKFDPLKYPQIVDNFHISGSVRDLTRLGVVSIDFLKAEKVDSPIPAETKVKTGNKIEWVDTERNYTGEELVSFMEHVNYMKNCGSISGDSILIKNWFKSVQLLAEHCAYDFSDENVASHMKRVNSRVARSVLLREFLGDCDYTDLNSGIVVNHEKQYMNYAPNFDYGESFNGLIRTKLDFLPNDFELELVLKHDKDFINKKVAQSKIPVEEIAKRFSSSTSEENLNYVIKNYPNDSREFLDSLKNAREHDDLDKIVDSYTKMTVDGKPILTKSDAEIFKTYIDCRSNWISGLIENKLKENDGLSK